MAGGGPMGADDCYATPSDTRDVEVHLGDPAALRAATLQQIAGALAADAPLAGLALDHPGPPPILAAVVAQVSRVLGPARGALARLDEGGGVLELFDHGLHEAGALPVDAQHPLCWCVRQRAPLFAAGAALDRWPRGPGQHDLSCLIALPCVVHGRAVGAVALGFESAPDLSPEIRAWLTAVAQLCAVALDRAALHARAQVALEAARAASARKDRFIAMLGHELRNPLAAITAAAAKHADGHPDWALVGRHAGHLGRMVHEMLDAAHMMEGAAPIRRAPVELHTAITLAVEMVEPLLARHGHTLQIDVPTEGLPVLGDPDRLAQAFVNLLTNAVRYSAPGAPIAVRAGARDGQAEVRVIDGGMGIASTDLERIFEFFVQGDSHPRRATSGLGLGLAIVRWVVDAHGGEVEARSLGAGQGSEFVITLPLHPAEPAAPAHPGGPPLRLLLVDDNADAAVLLGEVLALLGHEVRVVHDPVAALERVAVDGPWDAALVDIELPIMDGMELARQMRSRGAPVGRYIAVTGYDRPIRPVPEGAGFDAWLLKPVDPDQLIRCVRALMDEQAG